MSDVGKVFAVIVLGSIAFIVAGALLPSGLATYYDGVEALDTNANVSQIIVTLLELAPLGLPLAILMIFLAVGGLKMTGKM